MEDNFVECIILRLRVTMKPQSLKSYGAALRQKQEVVTRSHVNAKPAECSPNGNLVSVYSEILWQPAILWEI